MAEEERAPVYDIDGNEITGEGSVEFAAAADNADAEGAVEPTANPNAASTGELLKFLIDRTNYIKLLEEEDTPDRRRGSRTCANW